MDKTTLFKPEFQAVVLAGGIGNRLHPLASSDGPKSLLSLANKPMLSYSLEMLEASGFHEAIVITRSSQGKAMKEFVESWRQVVYRQGLKTLSHTMGIELVEVDGACGTADALRAAKHLIKTDFFVISADLVTTVPLHYLAEIHRAQEASFTALLHDPYSTVYPQSSSPAPSEESQKKKQVDDLEDRLIGLDGTALTSPSSDSPVDASHRLLLYKSQSDVEDDFLLHRSFLRRHPSFSLFTQLKDAHLYLFSRWTLELLCDNPEMTSLQNELIPFLVKHQYDPAFKNIVQQASSASMSRFSQSKALQLAHRMSHTNMNVNDSLLHQTQESESGSSSSSSSLSSVVNSLSNLSISGSSSSSASNNVPASISDVASLAAQHYFPVQQAYKCFVYVAPASSFCQRANTVASFVAMNRELAGRESENQTWIVEENYEEAWKRANTTPKVAIGGCFLADTHLRVGEGSSLKKCIIGRHVKIGANCRLSGCVLLDYASVGDGCKLDDVVISKYGTVQSKCTLKDAKVGPYVEVPSGTVELKGAEFSKEDIAEEDVEEEEIDEESQD